jgi:hypothetical protein
LNDNEHSGFTDSGNGADTGADMPADNSSRADPNPDYNAANHTKDET